MKKTDVCTQKKNGFTLVELLVVISIIAVLLAVLMPALSKAREMAKRTICASNLRQWAIAISSYASANNDSFPYNGMNCPYCGQIGADGTCPNGHDWKAGPDLSYGGTMVKNFWDKYILKRDKNIITGDNNVLFCPTQKWHRSSNDPTGVLNNGLCGYYFLVSKASWNTGDLPAAWNFGGTRDDRKWGGDVWVTKKKIGGKYKDLPIVMDIKQKFYTGSKWDWYSNTGIPVSSHARNKGVPEGGDYLFEDGHVKWIQNKEIGLGATVSGLWQCYYDIVKKYKAVD